MAKLIIAAITFFSLIILFIVTANAYTDAIFQEKKNIVKLRFFNHVRPRGENATAYEVARASITSNSPTMFGQVWVVDGPLTAEPDYNSREVGRFQGLIASADLKVSGYAMNVNFVFTTKEYSGSTISILGRNQIYNATRELAIVGGTGIFRMAHGYAIANTYFYDPVTNNSIVEFVLYFKCDGVSSAGK